MLQNSGRIAGVDLGDQFSSVCIIESQSGEVIEESRIRTRETDFQRYFARASRMRVAIETGTHSPWASRAITAAGHEVTVANAANVRLIHGGKRKNDRLDAEKLARLMRYDRKLLSPVKHRGAQAQAHLSILRSRDALVRGRTALVNHVRGVVKAFGFRIPKCETRLFHDRAREHIPAELQPALLPVLETIGGLTQQIRSIDTRVRDLCRDTYPETALLTQVHGVGELTALTFLLSIEDPQRFRKSRHVGAYLGLTPGQKQSGSSDPNRRITKAGDRELRRLLVQCAHRILGKRGIDSDLKRHGQKIMRPGTKEAKRRAVVAVARKLGVLLHRLWITGEVYEPLHNNRTSPMNA